MGLNGGPKYKINPSISMFVNCISDEEIERLWYKLSEECSVLIPLDKYPWSEKYGWIKDKYGLTWQFMKGDMPTPGPKITPSFLFTNAQYGKAEEALRFYTKVFAPSSILHLFHYAPSEQQPEGNLKFGQFQLNGEFFNAMDGPGSHEYIFNEGLSLVVECDTQEEIDQYWDALTAEGEESMCGWLKDKFGVSWQIVPSILGELMNDPKKSKRVVQAFLQMKKFDIERLMNA